MKTNLRTISAIATLIAAVSFSPLTALAHEHEGCPDQAGRHEKMMENKLGLSDQQKKDMKELFTKHHAQNAPLMKQLQTERQALRDLIHGGAADDAAIRAQAAKIATIEADLDVQRAHMAKSMRALLTPEQLKKFNSFHQDKHHGDMNRKGHCGEKHHKGE